MKERMTISIDKEIYDTLQVLPRKVSLSEVISWIVKATLQDIKTGRELTSRELKDWIEKTPEGKDFRDRLIECWGPGIDKVDATVDKVKKALKFERKKKKERGVAKKRDIKCYKT